MTEETRAEMYERGRRAGETSARLTGHDRDIRELRSSDEMLMTLTGGLDKAVQKLAIGATNLAESTLQMATALKLEKDSTAAALKLEKDTARDTLAGENRNSQSRWGKVQTIAAAASTVVGFLGYEYITHPH